MYFATVAKILNKDTISLDDKGFVITKIWNTANYERRQAWEATGKIPNYFQQTKELKDNYWCRHVQSHVAQAVLGQIDEAYKSWFALRKNGDKDARPPGFRKKKAISNIPFKKDALKVTNGQIRATLKAGEFYYLDYVLPPGIHITGDNLVKLELAKRKGLWYAHIVYKLQPKPLEDKGKVKAIDLGIIHTAATANEDGEVKIYTAKGALSIQRYFNKQIARVQSKSMNQNKQRWSKKLGCITTKKQRQINHFLHTTSHAIVKDCLAEGINRVVVGDLKNIRKGVNYGKKVNQKLHAWGFSKFTNQLKYKLELEGIQLIKVGEKSTSKTCSQCGYKESYKAQCRKHRGLYICRNCGTIMNADVNGALNILKRYLPEANVSWSSGCLAQPLVRRWNSNEFC